MHPFLDFPAQELPWIHWIQQFRNPVFDLFFKLLNFFDRPEFFFILIPTVWICRGWKTGMRLFAILFLSSFVNFSLKILFGCPRPFHLDPSVGILQVSGFGLPSGAAQTCVLLSGLLLTFWKSPWRWAVAILYVTLVSFSRVYLGVHFPLDVLVGWFIGFALWGLYVYVFPVVERGLRTWPLWLLFLSIELVPLALVLWRPTPPLLWIAPSAMGLGLGIFLSVWKGWTLLPSKGFKDFFIRSSMAVLGMFFIYFLIAFLPPSPLFSVLLYLLLGFWVSAGSVWICRKWLLL